MNGFASLLSLASVALACSPTAAGTALDTTAAGAHGAVATDQRLASETGLRILRAGGNAVDAAVAIGYTLAVTYPAAGNLGGGGFMLVRRAAGDAHFIDFRETAPAAATSGMYLNAAGNVDANRSTVGPLSAGVPGSVAGLEYARKKYGTLSRHELMRDAIEDANRGFVLSQADAAAIARAKGDLASFRSTAAIFEANGATPKARTVFRQPDLANTLRLIDRNGSDGFYRGPVAKELADSARASGGIISEADLAGYKPIERDPLRCTYRGALIITAPLPSSGGVTMCETLGILSSDVPGLPVRSFANTHLEVEAERRAFVDRNMQLGDPAFVPSKVARLLDTAYLARLRATIQPERATASATLHSGIALHEGTNTTNYSVVDAAGDAVDVTYTINNWFGSDFVAGRTGVLLNDEMDDFTSKPGAANMMRLVQGSANKIEPGKRPLSSMAPTIVADATGRTEFVTGAAGGPRIITTVLDTVRAVVDFHQGAGAALAAPRMHMQWMPDVIDAEPETFDDATLQRLRASGYTVDTGRPIGTVANAIAIDAGGTRFAAHDPRNRTGVASAY